MAMKLTGPIPGESLTRELGNAPWEQPPLYSSAEKALAWHLENITKEDNIDDLLFLVDQGFPISTFVESLTTKAVMEGYHTVDVSQLIAPVIHTYLKEAAQSAGIKYTEWDGPTEEEKQAAKYKQRLSLYAGNNLPREPEQPTGMASPFTPQAVNPVADGPQMSAGGPIMPMSSQQAGTNEDMTPPPVESLGPNQGYIQRRE